MRVWTDKTMAFVIEGWSDFYATCTRNDKVETYHYFKASLKNWRHITWNVNTAGEWYHLAFMCSMPC